MKVIRIVKPMIKNYVLKLYDILFLSLLRIVKLFLFCFSVSLSIPSNSKIGIEELFSIVFAQEAAVSREQAEKAVWKIKAGQTIGSGFFISANKIVTNFHVIENAESIGLENINLFQEGNPEQLKVKRIVSLSILEDLAVLEIEGEVSHFLNLPAEGLLNSSKMSYSPGDPEGKFQKIGQTGILTEDVSVENYSNAERMSVKPILNDSHQLAGVLFIRNKTLISFTNIEILRSFIESEHFLCKSLNVKECFKSSREIFIKSIQEAKKAVTLFKIAIIFYEGAGVEKDLFEARKWVEKSADQGYSPAQDFLAEMYSKGEGGGQDLPQAKRLLLQTALQGHISLYHKWTTLSLVFRKWLDSVSAKLTLSVMYSEGGGSRQNLLPLKEAVKRGDASVQYDLAMKYYEEKRSIEARKLIEESAKQGYAPAQHKLARIYSKEKRFIEARRLIEESAKQGYAPSQHELADIYKAEKRFLLSRELLEKSAEQGYIPAKNDLAGVFEQSLIQKLKTKCLDIFLKK